MTSKLPLVSRKMISRKVIGAVGIGGAVATLVVFVINVWKPDLIIPDTVVVALSTILGAFMGGWGFTEREDG